MESHVINDWFLGLPKERQQILLEDKWALATAFAEDYNRKLKQELKMAKFVMGKVKKHNKLTSHDNEMIRQVLEK